MPDLNWDIIITDALWFFVIVGWVALILGGLEADKPLSGGLPGHVNFAEAHDEKNWTSTDRLGALAAWIVFGAAALLLPVVLWWIFTFHEM